ncbi:MULTISPECIES: helix-turn-helix domain-containing protein [unclassified Crossiella]|uniref:winged helix-turn-helix transcriptional regulator n=1 Tax=unclassified Crossiella TaxID=2620835 RepID=UPI001FFFABB9|nr:MULTISPECIES: hypothetical protein [unclassified Crossiella]MCK2243702.1 hypothetical protein [Crossiella sp. S99.2]MCK2257561.1 hypothetical protein [Crossiella sp. S99.1]
MAGDEINWGEAQEALRVTRMDWAVPVLVALAKGPQTWTGLRARVQQGGMKTGRALYDKAYNRTLDAMVKGGLITRQETGGFPRTVTYRATSKAAGVLVALRSYDDWSQNHKA